MTLKEAIADFLTTDREQTHDEWRELKAFFAGMLVISIVWTMAWVSVKC